MTKVIFLDCDGVINSALRQDMRYFGIFFAERRLVAKVNRLIEESEALIVLSSTWRFCTDADLALRFLGVNLPRVFYKTDLNLRPRGEQIADFLRQMPNPKDVRYVVIDDTTVDIEPFIPNEFIVKIDPKIGITEADVELALSILSETQK